VWPVGRDRRARRAARFRTARRSVPTGHGGSVQRLHSLVDLPLPDVIFGARMAGRNKPQREFVADHVRGIPRSGIRDFFDIVQGVKDVISLGIGEPDFVTPWHIREAAIYALEHGRTTYTSNLGLLKLREAIARNVEKNFQVSYDPKTEVLVAVGVSEAMDLAFRAVINPGDEVIYHEPCYVSYA